MTAFRLRAALSASLLTVALGACSSGPAGSHASAGPSGPGPEARITIKDFRFQPARLTVHPGQGVTVVNEDSTAHTVTAEDKSFDTKAVNGGASVNFTAPEAAGTYPYICTIHQYMHATLVVG